MRSHDKAITSLSWCPLPFNIFWKINDHTSDASKKKKLEKRSFKIKNKCSEICNEPSRNSLAETNGISCAEETIPDGKLLENSDNYKKNETEEFSNERGNEEVQLPEGIKKNPWVNLKHADDDEVDDESPKTFPKIPVKDFLSECEDLKRRILSKVVQDISLDKSNCEESPENLPYHEVPSPGTDFMKDCVILENKILENIITPQNITEEFADNSSMQNLSVLQNDKIRNNADDDEVDDESSKTVPGIPVKDFLSESEDIKRRILLKDVQDTSLDKSNLEESPENLPHHEVPSAETDCMKDCVILEKKILKNITTTQHITEEFVDNPSMQSLSVLQDGKIENKTLDAICNDLPMCSAKVTCNNEVCNESQPEREYLLASSSFGKCVCFQFKIRRNHLFISGQFAFGEYILMVVYS